MKKLFLLLIGFTVLSCSSDSSEQETLPDSFSIDGVEALKISKGADLWYNNYYNCSLVDTSNPSNHIILSFDKYGNFISAEFHVNENYYGESYPYYSSNYFNFEMSEVNSKREFTIDFSGKVYENKYDMTSPFKTISGHITLQAVAESPEASWTTSMGLYADVDGEDWYSKNKLSHTYNSGYWTSYYASDDQYRLVFNMSGNSTDNGQYNFTPSSTNNYIRVEKFNTATMAYEPWNTQGIFTITGRHQPFQEEFYIDGTFSLTASNPSNPAEVVHFNNGVIDAMSL